MARPIKWHGIDSPPDYDIYTKRPSGEWHVMHACDGWVIRPPTLRCDPREGLRLVVGHVDRDTARLKAEELIKAQE